MVFIIFPLALPYQSHKTYLRPKSLFRPPKYPNNLFEEIEFGNNCVNL